MPTTAEIERLKALVDRLLPLSARGRGEVISADDWNIVVGALLEVARSVVESGADRDIPAHDHPDQVQLGWLDPRVRALIERGPLDDPVAVGRINAVQRGVAAAAERTEALAAEIRSVRNSAGRVEVSDLDRESTITRLTRRIDGLADGREDVTALRGSLDALREDLTSVSTFAEGFSNVTPAELLASMGAVEDLRSRLTTPTGALLDASEIERRLAELSTTLVTEQELSEAISGVRTRLPDDLRANIFEEVRVAAQHQAEASNSTLAERLQAQIAERLGEVEATATRAATEAAGQFRDTLRRELHDALQQELSNTIATGDAGVSADLRRAIANSAASLQVVIDQRATALEAGVGDRVRAEIARVQPELTATISATLADSVAEVSGRLGRTEASMGELRRTLTTAVTDVAANAERSTTEVRSELERGMRRVSAQLADAQTTLGESLRAEIASERQRVDRALDSVRAGIPRGLVTRDELLTTLGTETTRLRTEFATTIDARLVDRPFRPPLNPIDPNRPPG